MKAGNGNVRRQPPLGRGAVLAAACLVATACAAEPESLVHSAAAVPLQLAAGKAAVDTAAVENSPYGYYLAGRVASHQRDFTAAAEFMYRALESDPENGDLQRRAFLLTAAEGQHDRAVSLARKLVAQGGEYEIARLVLAVDSLQRGSLDEAEQLLAALSDDGLGGFVKPMVGSWLQLSRGDLDGALATLDATRKAEEFGALYELQVALLNDVAGRSEAAEAAYKAALERNGDNATLRLIWLVGNFYERQGNTEAATLVYQLFRSGPASASLLDPAMHRLMTGLRPAPAVGDYKQGTSEILFNLASLFSRRGYQESALISAHLALRLDPDFDMARILLGEILEGQERFASSVQVYRRIGPGSAFASMSRLRVAAALERLDRIDEAIGELEKLAEEQPEYSEPLFRVGNMLRAQERFGEAITAYDRAFDRLDENKSKHWTMHYFRGIALERSGQWERAEEDLLAALALEPEQPYVMNYLAYSWVEQKVRLEEAKKMLARANELEPDDGYIVDSLGWVLYRLGEYETAVYHLEKAVELRPQDPVINDHLGDAYWQVGREHEARFQWRRALSLEPEDDAVPLLRAKIRGGLAAKPEDI